MVAKLLVLAVAVFSLNLCAQNVESLTAEGTARIEVGEDQARDLATKDAYKDAVKKTLTVMFGEPAVRANELKLTPLYNDAKTYILESQQLQEKLDSGLQTISVKLNVNVDKDALQEYLSSKGISLTSEKNMMILPLIVERSGDNSGEFWWKDNSKDATAQKKSFSDIEKALSIYFAQSGYSLIDPYQNALSSQVPLSYRYMELKVPELIELGKTFNVGLIATGYVQTDCKKDDNSCSTVVSLQMISTDTGKIIAAKRAVETGSAGDADEAKTISRAKSCQTAAGSILSQMTKKWQKRTASSYRVVFKGLNDYASYAKLRTCLMSGINGLSSVIERYMTKGNMVFEAEKRGTSDTGQNIIAKCYPGGGASVLNQSQDFVEIKTQ